MIYLYRHIDKAGRLLYVGVSLNGVQRLIQHKNSSHWYSEIDYVKFEKHETREAALAAERAAITNENPLYNIRRPEVESSINDSKRRLESEIDLLKRVVQFQPIYDMNGAREVLCCGRAQLKSWIDEGKIGYVQMGSRKMITGWQLIEFIEYLEKARQMS